MAEFMLKPTHALDVEAMHLDGIRLEPVHDLVIHSIAFSGIANLFASIPVGRSAIIGELGGRLARLQPDQSFLIREHAGPLQLPEGVFLTDQSDGWVAARLWGARAIETLERICMLDLASDRMASGASVRTIMEHLGVILIREEETVFLLLSARSSAKPFWHALRVSVQNIS